MRTLEMEKVEETVKAVSLSTDKFITHSTLEIGVGTRTEDERGLKIHPTPEVFIKITTELGASLQFSVLPSMAARLGLRITEISRGLVAKG